MAVFFVFSDEAGQYRRERTNKFVRAHPYYCRAAVILDSVDWIRLKPEFYGLKKSLLNLEIQQEIKWSYIWSLYKHRKNNEKISLKRPYYFLRNYNPEDLLKFVEEALTLLKTRSSCQIIYTITINDRKRTPRILEANIIRMHLQDIMQRVEMQIQTIPDSISILFLDSVNQNTNKYLREAYQVIYQKGDFIKNYSHIKDSIAFELSHHSFGVQFADYCAGVLDGCLKNYEDSIGLFRDQIWDKIRRSDDGSVWGFGVREIPRRDENREYLKEIIERNLGEKDEIPF